MSMNITTAVDSLVKLINKEGKISVEEASKELGLPQNIINEWASFLDQEKIIHIEYKFTTPFLMSKAHVERNDKTEVDYEMIYRKLEVMRASIEKEQPKTDKQIKQKEYLIKQIKKLIETTKKKKITKEQLEQLIKYYKIFKERG